MQEFFNYQDLYSSVEASICYWTKKEVQTWSHSTITLQDTDWAYMYNIKNMDILSVQKKI